MIAITSRGCPIPLPTPLLFRILFLHNLLTAIHDSTEVGRFDHFHTIKTGVSSLRDLHHHRCTKCQWFQDWLYRLVVQLARLARLAALQLAQLVRLVRLAEAEAGVEAEYCNKSNHIHLS